MSKNHNHKHGVKGFCKHYVIGPFQFLLYVLVISEILLMGWMVGINPDDKMAYYERIVVGSFSITILIAVLVVFSVVYHIKKDKKDFDQWY